MHRLGRLVVDVGIGTEANVKVLGSNSFRITAEKDTGSDPEGKQPSVGTIKRFDHTGRLTATIRSRRGLPLLNHRTFIGVMEGSKVTLIRPGAEPAFTVAPDGFPWMLGNTVILATDTSLVGYRFGHPRPIWRRSGAVDPYTPPPDDVRGLVVGRASGAPTAGYDLVDPATGRP